MGSTVTTLEGRLLAVDDKFCALLCMNEGDLIGRDILSITHPDDQGDTEVDMRRLRDEARSFTILKRYIRADGAVIWAQATATFTSPARGEASIMGGIEPSEADHSLAARRRRDIAIFQALGALSILPPNGGQAR